MSLFRRRKRPRIHVSVFASTDVGRTRSHNEDSFLVADLTAPNASLQPEVREHDVGPRGSLFMVADGMGGAAAGEVASAMATNSIYEHLIASWGKDDADDAEQFALRLREAVEQANAKIHAQANTRPELRGMGTTVTLAGVLEDHVYLTQVGDSRAYLVRQGEAIQLTKDQSLMQRLVDAGEITEEEAERSERKNIILQALGPEARVKAELTFQHLRKGDALVLCSDGLSGQVTNEEIADLVSGDRELPEVCSALIALANERGGPDNITVMVARFAGDALTPARREERVGHHVYPPSGDLPDLDSPANPPPLPPRTHLLGVGAAATVLTVIALAVAAGFL